MCASIGKSIDFLERLAIENNEAENQNIQGAEQTDGEVSNDKFG